MDNKFDDFPDNIVSKLIANIPDSTKDDEPDKYEYWCASLLQLAQNNGKWTIPTTPTEFNSLVIQFVGEEPTSTVLDGKVISERITTVSGNLSHVLSHLPERKPSHAFINVETYSDFVVYFRDVLAVLKENNNVFDEAKHLYIRVTDKGHSSNCTSPAKDIEEAKVHANEIMKYMPNLTSLVAIRNSKDQVTRKLVNMLTEIYQRQLDSLNINGLDLWDLFGYIPTMIRIVRLARKREQIRKNDE